MPLLVLTADRPPELRDVGAGQTIDQVKLYGSAAKWYVEVDDHAATPERMRWLRQLACRACWTALDGRPGPVHLNFSLREPLVLDGAAARRRAGRRRARRRAAVGHAARPHRRRRAAAVVDTLAAELERARARCSSPGGAERDPRLGAALAAFADAGRAPAAGRPAVGRAPRPGGDRALRRAAARPGLRRGAACPTSCSASATCRPPSRCASGCAGWRRRSRSRFDPESAWQDPAGVVGDAAARRPARAARRARGAGSRAHPRARLARRVDARRPRRRGRDRVACSAPTTG